LPAESRVAGSWWYGQRKQKEEFAGFAFGAGEVSWWSKKERKNPAKPGTITSCRSSSIMEAKTETAKRRIQNRGEVAKPLWH